MNGCASRCASVMMTTLFALLSGPPRSVERHPLLPGPWPKDEVYSNLPTKLLTDQTRVSCGPNGTLNDQKRKKKHTHTHTHSLHLNSNHRISICFDSQFKLQYSLRPLNASECVRKSFLFCKSWNRFLSVCSRFFTGERDFSNFSNISMKTGRMTAEGFFVYVSNCQSEMIKACPHSANGAQILIVIYPINFFPSNISSLCCFLVDIYHSKVPGICFGFVHYLCFCVCTFWCFKQHKRIFPFTSIEFGVGGETAEPDIVKPQLIKLSAWSDTTRGTVNEPQKTPFCSLRFSIQYNIPVFFKVINVHAEQPHIFENSNFTVVFVKNEAALWENSLRDNAAIQKTHCFPSVFTRSVTQLNDLHWHSKLHLNYQFGSYAEPLASVCAAAICHGDMLGISGFLSSGPECSNRGQGGRTGC